MRPAAGQMDPDTNTVFVCDSPVREYVKWAMHGKLPRALLPTVLHELTHHWCLSGCVGRALAELSLESQEHLAASPLFPLYADDIVLAQWDTVEFARALLEPLLEGMAMFAQFDVYPGPSPVLSGTLAMLGRLFPPEEDETAADVIDALRHRLIEYRLSDQALRSKSGLLVQAMSSRNGGYLLGYLSVKNLWMQARKASPRLADADLFLLYLRNLVFDDAGFVDKLLDAGAQALHGTQAFDGLASHLNERLKLLSAPDLEQRVAEMEEALEKYSDLEGHGRCIYLDDQLVEDVNWRLYQRLRAIAPGLKDLKGPDLKGMTRAEKLHAIREFGAALDRAATGIDKVDPADLQRLLRIWAHLLHRAIVCLRVDQVECETGADGRCTVYANGDPVFSATARPKRKPDGRNPASLALYYLPDEYEIALVCVDDKGALFALFGDRVSATQQETLTQAIRIVLGDHDRREILGSYLRMHAGLRDEPLLRPGAVARLAEHFYFNHAMRFVVDAHLDACLKTLRTDGLWQILDEEGSHVNAMAALGLIQSWTSDETCIRALLQHREMDFDEVTARLFQAQAAHGLPLIHEGKRRVFL